MARRIVSLVPSLTESLCDLGLQSEIVACTSFCVEPPQLHRTVRLIGGTKDFDVDAILALKPTHILANQEENIKVGVERLAAEIPTLVTFPKGPLDVPGMLRDMGHFLQAEGEFSSSADQLEELLRKHRPLSKRRFLYFIWREPYMLAGKDTYISRFLEFWGWENAYTGNERYPAISTEAMLQCKADTMLLSTEPYPFRKRDAERLKAELGADAPGMFKIDGRMLSWFGTRTFKAWQMMENLHEEDLPKF